MRQPHEICNAAGCGGKTALRQELALLYRFIETFQNARDSTKNSTGAPAPQIQAKGDSSPIKNKPGKLVITKTGRI